MTWHEGSMIQYSKIKALEDGKHSIEVLGGYDHDQAALERAVMKKATQICKGEAIIESSRMGTYYSGGAAGGVAWSGNPPKINSVVKCTG